MVTTIQLHEKVKEDLNNLKSKNNETYEDVIVRLIRSRKQDKKKMEELLKEQCIEMAEDDRKINKEWSAIDVDWD